MIGRVAARIYGFASYLAFCPSILFAMGFAGHYLAKYF